MTVETRMWSCYTFLFSFTAKPIFQLGDIDEKWKKENNEDTTYKSETTTTGDASGFNLKTVKALRPKTRNERYNLAAPVGKDLVEIVAECGTKQFYSRLLVLKNLRDMWANGEEAIVVTRKRQDVNIAEGK